METYTMQRDAETDYQDDPCVCCYSGTQRIDADQCVIHGENPDYVEASENMREFAAGLPLIGDCAFSCDYDLRWLGEIETLWYCQFIRNGKRYEGHGSDSAAAYGRMIAEIVEREA